MGRIKVQILGNSYYVSVADGGEDRLRSAQADLSSGLRELMDRKPGMSALDALSLAALNLADQNAACEESTDRMREQLSGYMDEADRARGALQAARNDAEALRAENAALSEKLARLTKQRDDALSLVASLREESFRQASQTTLDDGAKAAEETEDTMETRL